jgi:glycosyltransferase involved in cell wall biosynthesis
MKILLLSDPNSSHTIKWVKSLSQKGINILVLGLSECKVSDYQNCKNVSIQNLGVPATLTKSRNSYFSKLIYLKSLQKVKKHIRHFKPDIVHAHYATSYGLLGALSGFRPFVLSVWGSDVFSFPRKSIFHKAIIQYNFRKADKILSTSKAMADEIQKYCSKKIEVTPFGIDPEKFQKFPVQTLFDEDSIVIGTIKSLEKEYGIEYLLKAFEIAMRKLPGLSLRLLIVGGGSLEKELKKLTKELAIEKQTLFVGKIPFDEVAKYHNMMDISVFLSLNESFGVAVIEAGACEKPVVVSNIGGLPEVVEDNVGGFIVPAMNPAAAASKLIRLIQDEKLRREMGKNARNRVKQMYNWKTNVEQMINIYQQILRFPVNPDE